MNRRRWRGRARLRTAACRVDRRKGGWYVAAARAQVTMTQPEALLLEQLYAGLSAELRSVDAEMSAALDADRPEVAAMIKHAGRYSGKKLRPALVFLVARAIGATTPR